MHRHPLGGRNFESYSEDPFLTGKLASQMIMGLQECGISATIKHFVANEQETQRTSVDKSISMRALKEIKRDLLETLRDCDQRSEALGYHDCL